MEHEFTKDTIKAGYKNVKLFPIYKMLSWDMLFYYSMLFLFLIEVKGLSPAQFIYIDAFYTVFKIFFQIPCTALIDKIGKRNSLIIANFFVTISIFMIIFSTGFSSILLAHLLQAFGFTIKGIAESLILFDSIETTSGKKSFSKVDGMGSAFYYYFESITCLISGFLYVINPYIPFVVCLIFATISTLLSFKFKEISIPKGMAENAVELTLSQRVQSYMSGLRHAFKFIFKSGRLRSFIIFAALFNSFLCLVGTYRRGLAKDLGMPAQYFGILWAVYGILTGLASQSQHKFHEKFRNKSLSVLSLTLTISSIVVSILALIHLNNLAALSLIVVIYGLQYIVKGPYYTLQKKYMNNFSDSEIRTKIYSAMSFIESFFRCIIAFLGGLLLDYMPTANAFLIFGIFSTITIAMALKYMKTRFGLKPEEYKKSDIEYVALK